MKMATPRYQLVDAKNALCYHLVSRCVRRGWLCGFDRVTGHDYSHRKEWLLSRLNQLGGAFSVDIYAYAIMSNHFHLVVFYDPTAPERWSDLEVVERWMRVSPPKRVDGSVDEALKQLRITAVLQDPSQLSALRTKLGSLSLFMKLLKQPIARRANREDECEGHFFEQRFYSAALLCEDAVVAAMAYVDLNAVRAKVARVITDIEHASITERMKTVFGDSELQNTICPVISGTGGGSRLRSLSLREYIKRLEVLTDQNSTFRAEMKFEKWRNQVASLKKRQRVFGSKALIELWNAARGWQMRESPLPE